MEDIKEREKLVKENTRLVHFICWELYCKYKNYKVIEYDDLYQEGLIALFKVSKPFDSKKGSKFSNYAYYYIRGRMKRYIARLLNTKRFNPNEFSIDTINTDYLVYKESSVINIKNNIDPIFSNLSLREKEILKKRYEENYSIDELSKIYNKDNKFIEYIEKRALGKLRCALTKDRCKELI